MTQLWSGATTIVVRENILLGRGAGGGVVPGTFNRLNVTFFSFSLVRFQVPGDQSYPLFAREKDTRLRSLQRRAETITNAFNSCENITCQPCQGAMYSFPRLQLPPKAIAAAEQAGVAPDVFYCLALLDATGISSTPGQTELVKFLPTLTFLS